jgi:hypothetical protein
MKSTDIIMQFAFDFTEREYSIKYFDAMDIVATLGGINGFLKPVLGVFGPLFILYFLILLANILIELYDTDYKNELVSFLMKSRGSIPNLEHCTLEELETMTKEVL